jgi:hypothetical protein
MGRERPGSRFRFVACAWTNGAVARMILGNARGSEETTCSIACGLRARRPHRVQRLDGLRGRSVWEEENTAGERFLFTSLDTYESAILQITD